MKDEFDERERLGLVAEMKTRSWTQRRLAELCGVRQPTISRIMSGTSQPQPRTKEALRRFISGRLTAVPRDALAEIAASAQFRDFVDLIGLKLTNS